MFIGVASARPAKHSLCDETLAGQMLGSLTRDALTDRRHTVNDSRQGKCLAIIPTRFVPFNAAAAWLERKMDTWGRFKERSKARESKCGPDYMAWYYSSGAKCVHEHEGAWNDPNAPYWGGFQADISFLSTYNLAAYRTWGTADRWPIIEQIEMAFNGWRARGGYPWPNTARACGLL